MTPEQLQSNLQKAIKLHQSQQLTRAESLYKKILKAYPESPDALHFYGLLHFHRGQLAPAKELMLAAIAYNPNYFDAYLNLGNLFLQTQEFDNAGKCYEKALEVAPENVGAATNYGILLRHQGAIEKSENILRRVCEQHPDLAVAQFNLANTLIAQKKYEQALERILIASNLKVNLSNVWTLGLKLCHQLDRPDTAQLLIDQWRASGNDPVVLEHIQAAYFTQNVPDRASNGYVKTVFDSYAASFESSLAGLKYQGPALLAQYLQQSNLGSQGKLTILDAGCGTGLCGPVLEPYAKRLFGIDLSPGMLKIAKSKGVYHRLIEGELTAELGKFDNHFDLISSMDVLIYFGDLQPLLAACYRAMKTKAVLVFTTEANDQGSDFRLDKTGRYLHSSSYLKDTLTALGFAVELTKTILRAESGEDVKGYLVVATK